MALPRLTSLKRKLLCGNQTSKKERKFKFNVEIQEIKGN